MTATRLSLAILLAGGCGETGGPGDGDSDADADIDTDADTDSDAECGPVNLEDADAACSSLDAVVTRYHANREWSGACTSETPIRVAARSAEELDVAWESFQEPRPAQPDVDWETQMVLVFAEIMNCPSCGGASFETDLYDCGGGPRLVLNYFSGACDGMWCAGVVVVTARDDREVTFESRLSGNGGFKCLCEGDDETWP